MFFYLEVLVFGLVIVGLVLVLFFVFVFCLNGVWWIGLGVLVVFFCLVGIMVFWFYVNLLGY